MQLSDFNYHLPEALIAQYPAAQRSASRLLHLADASVTDRQFIDLPDLLHPGDLLIFNNTKVMSARMYGKKMSGGQIELLIERLLAPKRALAHIRASKSPKPDSLIKVGENTLRIIQRHGVLFEIALLDSEFEILMRTEGCLPLPPYIQRSAHALDESRYQTVYAQHAGAVAAPTAGLHFDQPLLDRLQQAGIQCAEVTLHVGAGTFQPVRVENLDEHQMHHEWLQVSKQVCEQITKTKAAGGRVVAVGTTSVRSLETAASSGELSPYVGDTNLFIRPGYRFRVVDALITNFHLPRSTLLMLVSAFAGYENTLQAYRYAVRQKYRFFSYGDAMLIEPQINQPDDQ